MDKTIRKVTDLAEQRAETYRYWRSQPSSERFRATYELSVQMYRAHHENPVAVDSEIPVRDFARVKRTWS
jgi:hypothetical protein